jgi:hypothetical protein
VAADNPLHSLGWAAISWIEHYLVHGPGDVQGQRVELDDEFAAFIVKAYRVDLGGRRKVRRAFLSRSKGRSKSGLAGFIADFEALGPARFDHWAEAGEVSSWGYEYEEGEPVGTPLIYAEVLCVATEESQAGNTYDAIHYTLHPDTCSPELLADFGRLDVGLTRINLPNKRGFIEPVTSSNESKDGGKSTFIVADETHLWIPPAAGKFKLGRMHQTMVRNLLKRKIASGWMLETSTMYAEGENSVAEGTHAYAKSLAGRDGKLLFDHRQASEGYDLTRKSERIKALREAYGPAAEWMDLSEIADYWDDPQATHEEFKRFWLNQPVPLVPELQVMPTWPLCRTTEPAGRPAALGVAMDPDRVWLSCGSASSEAVPHLGPVTSKEFGRVLHVRASDPVFGKAQFVAEVARISREQQIPVFVDRKGPASDLEDDLDAAGAMVVAGGLDDSVTACADLYDAVEAKEVCHAGYAELDAAVAAADWRKVGDRRIFARRNGEISMLEAVTLALWGARQGINYDVMQSAW